MNPFTHTPAGVRPKNDCVFLLESPLQHIVNGQSNSCALPFLGSMLGVPPSSTNVDARGQEWAADYCIGQENAHEACANKWPPAPRMGRWDHKALCVRIIAALHMPTERKPFSVLRRLFIGTWKAMNGWRIHLKDTSLETFWPQPKAAHNGQQWQVKIINPKLITKRDLLAVCPLFTWRTAWNICCEQCRLGDWPVLADRNADINGGRDFLSQFLRLALCVSV